MFYSLILSSSKRALPHCYKANKRLPLQHYCTSKSMGVPPATTETTHFGFKTVPKQEKEEMVGEVFKRVAHKYDVMNDLMSMGIHRMWKNYFITKLNPLPGTSLLDVAGGTGDIAFRFLHHIKNSPLYLPHVTPSKVTVIDINPEMLVVGRERAVSQGYFREPPPRDPDIEFIEGNAEALPVSDNIVDAYTIAFGIRNCTNIDKVLTEAFRVLKPGGRFMCLEFSRVQNPVLSQIYDQYSFSVIPWLGQLVLKDHASYQYLVESIRKFPEQEVFSEMIGGVGFELVEHENLLNGVAVIHSGFKPM